MAEMIRKLTSRSLEVETEPGKSFVVFGRVTRATEASNDYGPFIRFKGMFEGLNEQTGKRATSTQFIAPGVGEDLIFNALSAAQMNDKSATVDFAMRFKTVEVDRKKAPIGYEWRAEMLTKPTGDDPLTRLASDIADKVPALAAPKSEGIKAA